MGNDTASNPCPVQPTPAVRPAHEIIQVPNQGQPGRELLLGQCLDVRIKVFHQEQKIPLEIEIDELDEVATHLLMRTLPSLDPMGTVRVYRKESGIYRMGRLAVLKDYRKSGFGRDLVARLHEWVKADAEDRLNAPSADVVAHSQKPVIGFYKALGYTAEGSEFDEAGTPHQRMVVRLDVAGT